MTQNTSRRRTPELREDTRGAIFVEFLIAFVPVYGFFLCLLQLALLFSVRLVTEHAAVGVARAAAVIVADDPKQYGDAANELRSSSSKRYKAVRDAALLFLSPLILNGSIEKVTLIFPPSETPAGTDRALPIQFTPMADKEVSKMRVRLEVEAICRIGLANLVVCRSHFPYATRTVRAEAIFPYQGASYAYP